MPIFDVTDDHKGEKRLVLDGRVLEDSSAGRSTNGLIYAHLWGDAIQQVESLSVLDLSTQFWLIEMRLPDTKEDSRDWSFTHIKLFWETVPHESITIHFGTKIEYLEWTMPYSVSELEAAFESILDANPQLGFEPEEELEDDLGVSCRVSVATNIREIIDISSRLPELTRLVEEELSNYEYDNSVMKRFHFPAPIRSACEQYLVYFAQFLRDLGIEANSELKEEANKVLFTVTPRNEKQALSSIRNALELYLQIPLAPDFNTAASNSSDVAVLQLKANVLHLQSQLALAGAFLEAKQATINAQDMRISALQGMLDLRQFALIELSNSSKSSDSEPIIPGVLAVKKYDLFKFLQIDFPEILRKLKRRW